MRCLIRNLAVAVVISSVAVRSYGAEIIHWETDVPAAFRQAQATNRPLLLHFWTTDCLPCKRLEHTVFNQPEVADAMQDFFIPVKVDADQFPKLAARYGVTRVPTDVIVSPDDQELHRMQTPPDANQYVAQLSAVAFRASSTKTARHVTGRPDYPSPGNLETANRWPPQDRDPRAAQDDRYSTDSFYSRRGTTDSVSYDGENHYQSDTHRSEPPEEQPREVINRFARRSTDENSRTPAADDTAAATNDEAKSGSRWGSWPQQTSGDSGARNAQTLPRDGGDEPMNEGRRMDNQYAANAGIDPSLTTRSTNQPPDRGAPSVRREEGNPPLGLDGYCPVSLIRKNSWTKGDSRYGVIHRGRTYLFAGPEEKELFFADPDEYSPVLAGVDPVQLSQSGEAIIGERANGVVYRKRVYLFSSEANLQQFWEEPERYASPIRQAMETGDVNRLFR